MKVYNQSCPIFGTKTAKAEPETEKPKAPAKDILSCAKEYRHKAEQVAQSCKPDLHAQYRALLQTDPTAAGKFWRENEDEIHRLALSKH